MTLSLPPLNALRAFESAARTGSYVAAAEELGVSPAAVSQHVRALERFLGKQLFSRFNNRVVLTEAGIAVAAGASEAFQQISGLTRQVKSGGNRPRLVISVLPSIAQRWLEPRLIGFAGQHTSLRLNLRIEDDPVDFARHDIDLRLCYGTNLYPEMQSVHLIHDEIQPLCGPRYLERNSAASARGMLAVPDDDLIHTDWGPSFVSQPTWRVWFARARLRRTPENRGHQVGMSAVALDLARDGLGVALAPRMMAMDDLSTGRLVALSELTVKLAHPYCLVSPRASGRKSDLKTLVDWLVNDVGQMNRAASLL